ncbi:hypothetical protein [Streptomyces alboflavus]|uniref:hypothetical protein n=1 Tax=Streptomyces alboflavus TaxID=67267 RepID=UPI000F656DA0|nr:hypothetical protein [Streptomyces alboflavus]
MTLHQERPDMITLDGRPIVSRAELHQTYGYATSALERWWRERDSNGHPDTVHSIGNTLYWDAEEWARWNHDRSTPPDGWSTRDQLAAEHNISTSTLGRLWRERASNGHPAPRTYDGVMHWDSTAWSQWHTALTQPAGDDEPDDADPDGDEEVGPAEFARILTHRDSSWVSKAAAADTPPPAFPAPDRWTDPANRRGPRWKRRRATHYARTRHTAAQAHAARYGRDGGKRPGGNPAKTHPYAGDPRLTQARRLLAEHPDEPTPRIIERLQHLTDTPSSDRTWRRIIDTARQHPHPTEPS